MTRSVVGAAGSGGAGVEEPEGEAAAVIEGRSPWRLAWDRLRHDRVAVGSAIVIVLVALVAICAPLIELVVGHGPVQQFRETGLSVSGIPVGPSSTFLFGTDDLGRDVLMRVVYGSRVSLLAGVVCSGISVVLGVVIGLTAGYFGRVVDTVLSRFMDVVLSLPYLVFAIALVSLVGPSLTISIAVISFFSFSAVGRVVRAQTMSAKEKEYVEASRSLGSSDVRIMFVDILPNVIAPVIVYATLLVPLSIVFMATLSFLGLGVVPPTPSWGNMLAESMAYYQVAWWFVVLPAFALLLTTLAFNLLGDSVRDAFDPRYNRLFTE